MEEEGGGKKEEEEEEEGKEGEKEKGNRNII